MSSIQKYMHFNDVNLNLESMRLRFILYFFNAVNNKNTLF